MEKIKIFGYGSLFWHPEEHTDNFQKATLHGWHRNYNVISTKNRGTKENKGIVLGLEKGGNCVGLIFDLPITELEHWKRREGVYAGVYEIKSIKKDGIKITVNGKPITEDCLVVVPNKNSSQFGGDLSIKERARMAVESSIAGGGEMGTSVEYIKRSYEAFLEKGIEDKALKEMYDEIMKYDI